VADLVKHHAITLKAVIDAQAAKDGNRAYSELRQAAHMQMIGDPLAGGDRQAVPRPVRGALSAGRARARKRAGAASTRLRFFRVPLNARTRKSRGCRILWGMESRFPPRTPA
jgi:hypothetical protein